MLMTGKTSQLVGNGMALFAVPLIAFGITGSVLWSGLIAGVSEVGMLVATLPAGVIADRVDRRRLLLVCSAVGAAVWLALWCMHVSGMLSGWEFATGLLIASAVAAFYAPTEAAGIRYVVPAGQLGSAMAAMQGRSAVSGLIASPLGGLLYGLGRALPMLAAAASYIVAAITTAFVHTPLNDAHGARGLGPIASLVEGLRFVSAVSVIRTSVIVIALINLGFGGVEVSINLHLVATRTAPLLIALVNVAASVAMLAGAAVTPYLVKRFPAGPLSILGLVPSVIGAGALAFADHYAEFVAFSALMAVFVPVTNSALLGYVSAITPHVMQARVNSAISMPALLVAPLAPVVSGALLSALGVGWTMSVFATVMLGAFIGFALNPAIRKVGRPDTWEKDLVNWPTTPPVG
ncbi:MFS transporter [Humibacter antri]